MRVFVLSCFWIWEAVSDHKKSGRLHMVHHRLLTLVGQELAEILSENKKIMAWEMDFAPRTMSRVIKQDLGLSNNKQDNTLSLH